MEIPYVKARRIWVQGILLTDKWIKEIFPIPSMSAESKSIFWEFVIYLSLSKSL